MKYYMLAALVILSGFVPNVSAAQLDANIVSEDLFVDPSFEFLRVMYIEYPEGGELAHLLQNTSNEIVFTADSNTPGIDDLIEQLNQNLRYLPSNAIVTDAQIHYHAILQGNANSAVIEYKVQLLPTITNHVIFNEFEKSIVDTNWRGISLDGPIMVETDYGLFDINNPKSALDVMIPNISAKLNNVKIIEMPIIDASKILDLPLHKWHSLFDNTAIIPSAAEYKYVGEYVITHYSMGECTLETGLCSDREWSEDVSLDTDYTIRIIESSDDATIAIDGYVDTTVIDGIEVFQTNLRYPVTSKPDTGEFPAIIIYGMAGIAAISGMAMFVISDRKLKRAKDDLTQTGINPSDLQSYETSNSSGGYKTNRGESYLISCKESRMPL
ncbi:MAG: hypothetical protein ACRBB2_05195 [Nitrosopumilus sp.]